MGKSYRTNKIFGWSKATSEKKDKTFHHRKMRRRINMQLHKEEFDTPFPTDEEVSDVWTWNKDGKQYWPGATKRDMQK
jgi:hypothetical protein